MNSGELKVDVPLASLDSEDEETTDSARSSSVTRRKPAKKGSACLAPSSGAGSRAGSTNRKASPRFNLDGGDSVTGSLEDLVNSFDEKLTKVFHDYQENVNKIAPVQVRSQEEIMNECQVWWTITGNFGNMMPIDWSKSTARARHLPTLNLSQQRRKRPSEENSDEDEDLVAADLDMHSLILNSNPTEGTEPVKTAEEVLREIDDMIEEDEEKGLEEEEEEPQQASLPSRAAPGLPSYQRSTRMVSQALAGRKLEELSTNELTQILSDIELLVRDLSEELVYDLGVRDELEYEKELKNTFISLLLSIQSKRRQHVAEGGHKTRRDPRDSYKYLTTVIPYQPDKGTPPLPSLQVLVKILKAINEDSPAVPALLTDYILKVLCPS